MSCATHERWTYLPLSKTIMALKVYAVKGLFSCLLLFFSMHSIIMAISRWAWVSQWLVCIILTGGYTHTHTHTHTPFYGSLDFVRDNPGEPVPEGTFHHLLDFQQQNEDNTGRCTNNLDGLPPHPDKLVPPPLPSPPFLCRMLFLTQPSQFILAWDRYQICWLAYLVAWFNRWL